MAARGADDPAVQGVMDRDCILVTGGTGKIGRSLVSALLARGSQVVATGASEASIADLADAHRPAADEGRLVGMALDLAADDAVHALVAAMSTRGIRPTGLVNAARDRRLLATEPDGSVCRSNFLGELLLATVVPYELTLALAHMPGSRLRSVVNVASMYGLVAPTPALYDGDLSRSPASYGVGKAAMLQLTRELAVRLAPKVRVNAVSFGGVEGRSSAEFLQRYAALTPSRRMLREDEVVQPILFLLDDGSSSVVGANLVADGGWTAW
jgi:NAD(P)-dependent dehydrogenase (short-subunit alcohol dehydrogenase family)